MFICKKCVAIATMGFFLSGCSMSTVYLKRHRIYTPYDNTPVPIYTFITTERKKILDDKDQPGFVKYGSGNEDIFHVCDKQLVNTTFPYQCCMWFSIIATAGFFGLIYLFAKDTRTELLTSDYTSSQEVENIAFYLGEKFQLIDASSQYDSAESFIEDCKTVPGRYFAVINTYEIDNINLEFDTTKQNGVRSWYKYNLYTAVGVVRLYAPKNNHSKKILCYQKIFYPERLQKIAKDSSTFETLDMLDSKRAKDIADMMKSCFVPEH